MSERLRRAWHPEVSGEGAVLTLGPEESHHLVRVLRLRAGDRIGVFDGCGREWDATILEATAGGVVVETGAALTDVVEPGLDVTLFQGLCRAERLEWVLQKGTEVGVGRFVLTRAARAEDAGAGRPRLDRLRRIVLEACKQSRRRRIPELAGPRTLPVSPPVGTFVILFDPAEDALPLRTVLGRSRPAVVWVGIGPEGGFDDAEVAAARAGGWIVASLGPRVLRTETAGIVACAVVLAAWDDLGSPHP